MNLARNTHNIILFPSVFFFSIILLCVSSFVIWLPLARSLTHTPCCFRLCWLARTLSYRLHASDFRCVWLFKSHSHSERVALKRWWSHLVSFEPNRLITYNKFLSIIYLRITIRDMQATRCYSVPIICARESNLKSEQETKEKKKKSLTKTEK